VGPEEDHKNEQRTRALSYEERLRVLGLFSLENRRLQETLIAPFQYSEGAYKKDGDKHFSRACCNRTRGNGFKLEDGRYRLAVRRKFFTMRVVKGGLQVLVAIGQGVMTLN